MPRKEKWQGDGIRRTKGGWKQVRVSKPGCEDVARMAEVAADLPFAGIIVLDVDLIGEKLRSTVPERREMAIEGTLMHGIVNELSGPGHS